MPSSTRCDPPPWREALCGRGWWIRKYRQVGGGGGRGMCPAPPVPGNQNFARVSPLFSKFWKISLPVVASAGTLITSLPPPPPVPVGVRGGGVRPFQPLWPKFLHGFPPISEMSKHYRPVAASTGTPVASLSLPLCPWVCARGLGLSDPCG